MLAAVLAGGQVFADSIPTSVEGYEAQFADIDFYGKNVSGGNATGGDVTISASETGGTVRNVYGGYADGENLAASGNKVTMNSGEVISSIYGGCIINAEVHGAASRNTVIIKGGAVSSDVYGGKGVDVANGNVVILAGDCSVKNVYGGSCSYLHNEIKDNKVYLVGKGATATIADAQGITSTYTGGEIKAAAQIDSNSIDIYGTGISALALAFQSSEPCLNFHIVGAQAEESAPMLTLKGRLSLKGMNMNLYGEATTDWSAFAGKSVTLISNASTIVMGEGSLGDVEIKAADGAVVATATLALGNSNKSLVMSNIKGTAPVPEPTTGTLGLLALAGLCIRRRK